MAKDPASADRGADPAAAASVAPPARSGLGTVVLLLAAGLAAGTAAGFAVERYGRFFHDPAADDPNASKEVFVKEKVNTSLNAALSGELFGLAVGGLLGVAAGVARRSASAAAVGLVAGGLLGAAFGAGAGWLDLVGWERLTFLRVERPTAALAMHAVMFCLAGLGVGLGLGLANGRVFRMALSVAAGGLIGGLLCSPVTAFVLPMEDADLPIPLKRGTILIWTLLPAALMGLAAGRALPPRAPRVTVAG